MKILLIHYAYFITGGPERYLFNVKRLLEGKGHYVIPFSMKNKENIPSKYENYFASSINTDGSWYFNKKSELKSKLKQIKRLFYSKEVENKLSKLIIDEKPDIAYLLLYQKKLSPAVLVACKKHGVPIVSRLSDYQMMCPKYTFYRDGNICEECKNSKLYSLKYKCIKKSFVSSLLWLFADAYHHYMKFYDLIDVFVLTNPFINIKLREYGYKKKKHIIRTCSDNNRNYLKSYHEKKSIQQLCYIGNIFEHKGVDLLLQSLSTLIERNPKLNLVIMGNDPENIIKNSNRSIKNVKYIKHSNKNKVLEVLSESLYFVLPAKWYENLPNAIIESFSVGTPVISTNIGSIRYMVENERTGFLFEKGRVENLTNVINNALSIPQNQYEQMQRRCLNEINLRYSYDKHYQSLIKLFENVTNIT
jgi:glycosyltransferase involved in cell wall biosynthesis